MIIYPKVLQDKIFHIAGKITKHSFKTIWGLESNAMTAPRKEKITEEMFFKGIAGHTPYAVYTRNIK